MIISLVVAVADNGVIGRDGTLPWRISSDLKTFRRLTMGKPLIMGRRTFQSLKKPLDGRDNIVVTRNPDYRPAGAIIAPGFVDLHIHFPQIDVIGSPAAGLLPWLENYTFPHESRFSDEAHCSELATSFLDELLRCIGARDCAS